MIMIKMRIIMMIRMMRMIKMRTTRLGASGSGSSRLLHSGSKPGWTLSTTQIGFQIIIKIIMIIIVIIVIVIFVVVMILILISQLEREAEELEAAGMAAEAEDQRMRELCGEYSGQLQHHDKIDIGHCLIVDTSQISNLPPGQATRLRRKLKKEMDKDEESYMEMFI